MTFKYVVWKLTDMGSNIQVTTVWTFYAEEVIGSGIKGDCKPGIQVIKLVNTRGV